MQIMVQHTKKAAWGLDADYSCSDLRGKALSTTCTTASPFCIETSKFPALDPLHLIISYNFLFKSFLCYLILNTMISSFFLQIFQVPLSLTYKPSFYYSIYFLYNEVLQYFNFQCSFSRWPNHCLHDRCCCRIPPLQTASSSIVLPKSRGANA